MNTASIALDTIGCKLNQAESDALTREFLNAGYHMVSPDKKTDVYILNTCTVTHVADRKARHLLRLARRRNPNALVIAIGCYTKRAYQEIKNIDGVNLVVDDHQNQNLVGLIAEAGYRPKSTAEPNRPFRTRAMLKMQQGCNRHCSYCIVPQTRGKELSIPATKVLNEVGHLIEDGFKEIVLTGTHIGAHDDLVSLVEQILEKTQIERIRLSSLQPADITPSLLKLWQDERLCRHMHLPLQSGSDTVLSRMGRWYSTADFENAVNLARKSIPEISITTDIIVGFPGENEAEFEQSCDFCRRIGFANLHVFTYSPRPNTLAASMKDLSSQTKKERSTKMLKLAKKLSHGFNNRFIGQTMLVLWESKTGSHAEGLTDNYIRVFTKNSGNLSNRLLPTKLVSSYKNGLMGELSDID